MKPIAKHINGIPPRLCLALAIERNRALTLEAIARLAQVPYRTLCRIASKPDWSSVKLGTMSAIAFACKVDLLYQGRPRKRLCQMLLHRHVPLSSFKHPSQKRRRQAALADVKRIAQT